MRKQFVKINGKIFDYKDYIKEVDFLKYEIKRRILDILEKDFITLKCVDEDKFSLTLKLYNKKLDIYFEIMCKKSKPLHFI